MAKTMKYVISCILLCIVLTCIGTMIPPRLVKPQLRKSIDNFSEQVSYPNVIKEYESSKLDDYTDALLLAIAGYDGNESFLHKAAANERWESGIDTAQDLRLCLEDTQAQKTVTEYARYWFGSVAVIRLLLLFFSYSDIQMMNQMLQLGLLVLVMISLFRHKLEHLCLPFFASVLFLTPVSVMLSLQFSSVYLIAMISALLLLHIETSWMLRTENRIAFFMCVGVVTNWLDLLTYPLITLGFPLIIWMAVQEKNKKPERLGGVCMLIAAWGIGYGGMWMLKWVFASLVLGRNVFAEALSQILLRTASDTGERHLTAVLVVAKNVWMVCKKPYIGLALGTAVYEGWKWFRHIGNKGVFGIGRWSENLPWMLVAVLPFVWYVGLKNHSWVHAYFTYRELSVSVLAVFAWMGVRGRRYLEGASYGYKDAT